MRPNLFLKHALANLLKNDAASSGGGRHCSHLWHSFRKTASPLGSRARGWGRRDLRPDHSYLSQSPTRSSRLRWGSPLVHKNWDRDQSSGLRSHTRDDGRGMLLVAALLTGILLSTG